MKSKAYLSCTVMQRYRERFWSWVVKGDGCWNWSGRRSSGYGRAWDGNKAVGAHRLSYLMAFGDIPTGMHVCHRCDNRLCVRPEHLFLGTEVDNNRDRDIKKRTARGERSPSRMNRRSYQGENNGRSKLTSELVERIRVLYANGGETTYGLARRFGMSQPQISGIIKGEQWPHAPGPRSVIRPYRRAVEATR